MVNMKIFVAAFGGSSVVAVRVGLKPTITEDEIKEHEGLKAHEEDGDHQVIVLDIGSGYMKAGFAGDDAPRAVFPMIVGRVSAVNINTEMGGEGQPAEYIGDEAQSKRTLLDISYPVEHGIITNWEDMKKILHHTFYNELRVAPEECYVILTEAPKNPRENRIKLAEMLFDEEDGFDVKGVYFELQAVLSLYASGRTTGIVLDIGAGVSHAIPIYEGFILPALERLDIAGRDLDKAFSEFLQIESGVSLNNDAEMRIIEDMKEKLCYVALDFDAELEKSKESSELNKIYELSDKTKVPVNSERFRVPEVLFQPKLIGKPDQGIHDMLFKSIMRCGVDARPAMYGNIILSGGSTMYDGMRERIVKEITSLANAGNDIKVVAKPERKYSVWIGASILGSLQAFLSRQVVTRETWDQEGPQSIFRTQD